MMKSAAFFCWCVLGAVILNPPVQAGQFSELNPDIHKFEFARSYIASLSFLKNINTRWEKYSPQKKFPANDRLVIQTSIDFLVKDNTDLRITKNYLIKYLNSPNALIRKAADIVVNACEREIQLNDKEKILWQEWLSMKLKGQADREQERLFVNRQANYALQKKEIDKTIIEASVLVANVLKSASNRDEKGNTLAITRIQRKKLVDKLDTFAKDQLDWGIKPGQSPLSASVAVIREILEDPVWISIDAKR